MSVRLNILIATLSVIILAGVCSLTLVARANDNKSKEFRQQIENREKEYVKEVKNVLAESGFENAGVNLTKVTDENMNMNYRLVINHHSFMYAKSEKTDMLEDMFSNSESFYLDGPVTVEFSY